MHSRRTWLELSGSGEVSSPLHAGQWISLAIPRLGDLCPSGTWSMIQSEITLRELVRARLTP